MLFESQAQGTDEQWKEMIPKKKKILSEAENGREERYLPGHILKCILFYIIFIYILYIYVYIIYVIFYE